VAECHGGIANSGPGSVEITVGDRPIGDYLYAPGETVELRVTVRDGQQGPSPRWGFQLTARASEGCATPGTFSPAGDNFVLLQGDTASSGPCAGQEARFVTHKFPKAGANAFAGGATFAVNWTAPAADVGPITFAAAGNAANGNNQSTGDRIYTNATAVGAQQAGSPGPAINAGGVAIANLLPSVAGVVPNAIISIFGQSLAPNGTARDVQPEDLVDGKLPTQLAGVCVEVNGQPAPILAVRPNQLNVQTPTLSALGPVAVEVVTECGSPNPNRSGPEMAVAQSLAPAFFVKSFSDPEGGNPIAALHGGGPAEVGDPGLIPGATPAEPGEFISLFGTGFGLTQPVVEAGEIPQTVLPPEGGAPVQGVVSVSIGEIPVPPEDVFYVGVAPCCAGLYQAVVKVPEAAQDGDLPVVLTIDGVSTPGGPFVTVQRP
jgi:uncharacterized protein (TIGR03437 family)